MDKRALRLGAAAALAAALIIGLAAQEYGPPGRRQESKLPPTYTVGGVRHGISYFPKTDYAFTKPKRAGDIDFAHYHTYDEVAAILRKWAADYPNLVDLYSVGKSFEGRDIWQITITNKATGKDTDKPAMFLEGNRHSGEVTAAESALWFAAHVLGGYGQDPALTALVDTKALYVRVKNNPDGSEMYLNTAQSNRSTVRPFDDDRDGLLDEDPPEDLDGDGFILQMRKKVEPGKGTMIVDPADPSGRLMKRVGAGKGDYLTYPEGLDNDGDGRTNEDGIGGLDLHRNYPENWRPMPGRDLTGRGFTQGGAGEYPLSEPETRAVFSFLLEHPNVSIGQTMDTTVPMLLHGPSTSRMSESMFPEDMKIFHYFDEQGKRITGYPDAGDTYWDYANLGRDDRERRALAAEFGFEIPAEPRGEPLFGHSPDFGYLYYGAVWYGDELWNGGRVKDYDGDGRMTELESLRYIDEELGGRYFKPWTKFVHPTLGQVEIGGFNPKFWRQNPPVELLEEWIAKEARFNLFLAKSLPQVKVVSAEVRQVRKEPGTIEIVAFFTNEGYLPTALKMADRVKIVRPDAASIRLPEGAELAGAAARQDLGFLRQNEKKEVRWKIKVKPGTSGEAEVSISSTRGGTARTTVKIG
ncbi:MAG TPA: M14 family metallopeptidase [Candidatus Aminicenantes bacterium]|nr:M14 family metallopeptidase [Candidatus Aminicenantes bacterium]HRY64189.1 M14 family metallopeptidase [Candidatus Aminicenantes bacterium]HRZ71102.1 M14 family metallopeptidase [Candidatus Aminicenantes bacterium]